MLEISPAIYRAENPENPKSLKKVSREEFGTPRPRTPKKSQKGPRSQENSWFSEFFLTSRTFLGLFRGPGSGGPKLLSGDFFETFRVFRVFGSVDGGGDLKPMPLLEVLFPLWATSLLITPRLLLLVQSQKLWEGWEEEESERGNPQQNRSWFLGSGFGQQLFNFRSPAVHWMARTSSLNCLSCRNPYQTPLSLNPSPLFTEKPFFFTEKCFVGSPAQKSAPTKCSTMAQFIFPKEPLDMSLARRPALLEIAFSSIKRNRSEVPARGGLGEGWGGQGEKRTSKVLIFLRVWPFFVHALHV